MLLILVTEPVSNSGTVSRALQNRNIPLMSVAELVSNRGTDVRASHPANIYAIVIIPVLLAPSTSIKS